jgi:phospholipid/cholesterol/gamma-HCH transport system substrate-binding protein
MANSRTLEITVGLFIAAGFVALFFLAMQVSNLSGVTGGTGYEVKAKFHNVGSLTERAPVTIAGVRVGRVKSIHYDPQSFEAVVTMKIDGRYTQIPDDTFAKIYTSGLLGEQYVGLDPGGSDSYLKQGSRIELTQSALVLEEILGQLIYKFAEKETTQ